MSETLTLDNPTYEVTAVGSESQTQTSEASGGSHEKKPWGSDLMEYVLANQNTIVKCPWMGGAEVTLGEAMWTYSYPPNMSEKDVPAVMAVVRELLASSVIENEEPKEENQEEQAGKVEEENIQEQAVQADKEVPELKLKAEDKVSAKTETNKKETITTKETNQLGVEQPEIAEAKRLETADIIEPKLPSHAPNVANTSTPAKTTNGSPDKSGKDSPSVFRPSAEPEKRAVASNLVPNQVSAVGVQTSSNNPKTASEGATELFKPVDLAPDLDMEAAGINYDKTETPNLYEELVVPNELIQLDEMNQETESLDYEIEGLDVSELNEPELLFNQDRQEIVELYEGPAILDSAKENIFQAAESPITEQAAEIVDRLNRLEVPELDAPLLQTVTTIEAEQPELIKAINMNLDRIYELSAKITAENGDMTNKAEEELKELFTEIFEQLGISYTAESLDHLVRLSINGEFSHEVEQPQEEDDEIAKDNGTHEVISKKLTGSSKLKRIMANACAIGKSALCLYHYDFPTELKKRLAAA